MRGNSFATVYIVQRQGTYLSQNPFVIKIDQKSIKFLLEQRLNTPFQQAWMSKLMGFDFEIPYKEGVENKAANALSRKSRPELLPMMLDNAQEGLFDSIKVSWHQDPSLQTTIKDLHSNPTSHSKCTWYKDELRRKGKLVNGVDYKIKKPILHCLHDSPFGGYSSRYVTTTRVKSLFFWKDMNKDIQQSCHRSKPDLVASPGLFQPLPIPSKVWNHINMDFIEGLPSLVRKQVIFVVVDRLTKYAHYLCPYPTLILPLMLPNFSQITSSSYMACLVRLLVTETPFSLAIFGVTYLSFREFA